MKHEHNYALSHSVPLSPHPPADSLSLCLVPGAEGRAARVAPLLPLAPRERLVDCHCGRKGDFWLCWARRRGGRGRGGGRDGRDQASSAFGSSRACVGIRRRRRRGLLCALVILSLEGDRGPLHHLFGPVRRPDKGCAIESLAGGAVTVGAQA